MSLASLSVEKRSLSWFIAAVLIVAGIGTFFNLGQLEDPEFTVKAAIITTFYPGASPEEVELEVTDPIEQAIQQLHQLKNVYSFSRAGVSIIQVDIIDEYWADRLPQVWDELRKKIRNIRSTLPPGASTPQVSDDFSEVFGFVLGITGEGFNYAELEEYAKAVRKELSLVPGVARVELWGTQDKVVYLNASQKQLTELGLTPEDALLILNQQNMVVDAGYIDVQNQRLRIEPTGEFTTPTEIGELALNTSLMDKLYNLGASTQAEAPIKFRDFSNLKPVDLIRVKDIATVESGYLEPPRWLMRYNGQPALSISISNTSGVNIVEVGKAINEKLQEIEPELPVGIELNRIAWQSDLVDKSINDFLINLAEAIIIVLVVLWLTMGLRLAVVVGIGGLIFTILGTFVFMKILGIDLHRVSLGALVIALGMMVNNAIVVADGISVKMQSGMERIKAAIQSASQPSWSLLGATLIASLAFYPIFYSPGETGEYARSLFQVVATSLILSWILAVTVTPLICIALLPEPKKTEEGYDPYSGNFFQIYKKQLEKLIKYRWTFLTVMIALLALSIFSFRYIPVMFFSDSTRPQMMIDYWAPEGTRIQEVSENLKKIEDKLLESDNVKNVSTFIGQGPPRFYLPVSPELPNQAYAQIVVNTPSFENVDKLVLEMEPWLVENFPDALIRLRKYSVGTSDNWQIEARFSGPAVADPKILRSLSDQGVAILKASPLAMNVRTNWRQRVKKIVANYDQERARWSGVSRKDIADSTRRAHDGQLVGLYREKDELHPIMLRLVEEERKNTATNLDVLQIQPSMSTETIPMSEVTEGIEVEWEDPVIHRWDRKRAITVQASPKNATATALLESIRPEFEAIELPPGYRLEWDGEDDSMRASQNSLVPGLAPSVLAILLILVLLYNGFKPPIIIILIIPFAAIGIVMGLFLTGVSFGFMALIGAMSLAGMMIQNAVVLIDEINLQQKEGKTPYNAVVDSSISRLRPVLNSAATTILGMAPLLQDVFWKSMAVSIMAGLTVGTIVTMTVLPILYAVFYKIKSPDTT
jgi:multidrug efflux pump subunit AcrB